MFLQPQKVPVKVYLSTDKDAPRLDRTPNCVATILKACLVTGYGDKEGAGWTIPFEDTSKGIKVFRPEISPHADFFMRVSNDTGREMTVQVYQNMTSVDDGDLKLQCDTAFKYAVGSVTSNKWMVIACGRAFWVFCETAKRVTATQSGTHLYCGDTAKISVGETAIYLKHTGGSWGIGDHDRYTILNGNGNSGSTIGKLFHDKTNTSANADPVSLFKGDKVQSTYTLLTPVLLMSDDEVFALPIYAPSTINLHNYENLHAFGRTLINHATGTYSRNNFLIPTDYWEF